MVSAGGGVGSAGIFCGGAASTGALGATLSNGAPHALQKRSSGPDCFPHDVQNAMETSVNFGDKPPEISGLLTVMRNISLHAEECNRRVAA
jgi:hypothetical protein